MTRFFARLDFLGFLTAVAQFVSIRVPALPGSKWAFLGLEKIGRDMKSRFVVRNDEMACVWELARDHHAWSVMDPREVPLLQAPRDLSLSFCRFLSLFALWTPFRLFYSFTHILLSGTPIDAPFSLTRSTSKHLPIPTIYFSFKRSKCADLVILFFVSFGLFLMIQDSDRRSVFAYASYR